MGELINLFKLLSDKIPGATGVNLFFIIMSIWIPYKKKIIRHPRYLLRYVVFTLLLFMLVNYILFGLIEARDVAILVIISILLLLYAIVGYIAVKKPVGISKMKLKRLENAVEQGLSSDEDGIFDNKPFYIMDFAEIFQYKLLHANHLMVLSDFKGAYEVYNSIGEKKLFPAEKRLVLRKKAHVLFYLGDMTRAKKSLNLIEDANEPNYLMLTAMIHKKAGELGDAAEYFQNALNSISNKNEGILEAMVYNNYGRLRYIEGNILDAINYYRFSANIAKRHKNKEMVHASFQNLIHLSSLQGEYETCKNYLLEYEGLIDTNLLEDAREYYNLKIEIERQNPNQNNLNEVIIVGYFDIRERLQENKELLFDISVLRMVFNARMNFGVIMEQIYLNQDRYFTLEMPEKYLALKEVGIVLREVNYPKFHKYAWLFKRIVHYMRKDALIEIENSISILKDYEINQRSHLEKEKVGVLREHIRPYNFQTIYNRLIAIKDIFKKNGMVIDALMTDLDIADECFALENLEGEQIKDFPLEKMKEHVEYAEEAISKLKKYPIVNECKIRLAIYFLKLKQINKAKKHLAAFESGGISINNYSFWIQKDYKFLKTNLNSHKTPAEL